MVLIKQQVKDLRINNITKATKEEWDQAWLGCDYSTFFHSREWAEIWNVYTNGKIRPDAKLILFSDGKKALIPFSLQRRMKGLVKSYISSPAGTFGGWISGDELTTEHTKLLVKYMTKLGNLTWRENPYDPNLSQLHISSAKEDFTQVLDLREGFESIYKKWTKGNASTARKARKARKAGVTIGQAVSIKEWRCYYNIYKDSLRRWGKKATSSYNWPLFEILFNKKSEKIKLWLAFYKNEIIAGALCFYHNKHVVYWHGAAYEKCFHLRPSNLLQCEIIKDACQKGCWWYDFNPSGGHKGVVNFKGSFGAKALRSVVLHNEYPCYHFIKDIKKVMKAFRVCVNLVANPIRILNEIISPFERYILKKNTDRFLKYPPVFILGLPRSGTTLLYQILVHGFHFSYFPNICGNLYKTPALATIVAKKLLPDYRSDFESKFGKVQGLMAPREAGGIWGRWFDQDRYTAFDSLSSEKIIELKATIAIVENAFDAPFINKNVKHLLRLDTIARLFENSIFLITKRDKTAVTCSILKGRKKNCKKLTDWWSVKPRNYMNIKDKDHIEQICEQVYFIEKDLQVYIEKIGSNRFHFVDYERLCKDVNEEIGSVLKFLTNHGLRPVKKNKLPSAFSINNSKKFVNKEEGLRITQKLKELYGE